MKSTISIERHELGPRLHLFGRRIHEYQVGLTILAASPGATLARSAPLSRWTAVATLAGFWLVVKDWPDLFPATRDRASWRLGIHRLPREGDKHAGRRRIERGPSPAGTLTVETAAA